MTDAAISPANPFWNFSLRLYARPRVAPACLALQERRGIDVNVLLYCIWLGADRGVGVSEADAAKIAACVASWHDAVVRPLRAVRVDMKTARHGAPAALCDALRNDIKRAELDAERIEQQILFTQSWSDAPGATRSTPIARDNIYAYLKSLGIRPDSQDEGEVGIILAGLET
ncbi:MAG: hypothetical protein K0Q70_768 [Rhodospirillales bacterium]|jgi:uncharacterized protein (TIGR02444 family)|nr:hypothetical protein [Rhodospirillales bacterium]